MRTTLREQRWIADATTALAILEGASGEREGEASAALRLTMTLGTALGAGIAGALLATITGGGALVAGIGAAFAASPGVLLLALAAARRVATRRAAVAADGMP